jgi:hypothetical protein
MVNNNLSTLTEDEHQIASLLIRWGHARDSDDWETLAGCFHDDARIHISWISGPAKDYIARSRVMAAARKSGEHAKHLISGAWIQVNQDRAFTRCHANLYVRTTIKGHECDLQSWIRFFDLLKKNDDVWRIVKRTAVYEKDRLEPVDPRGVPKTSSTIWSCRHSRHQPSFSAIGSCAVVVWLRLTSSLSTVIGNAGYGKRVRGG